MIISATWSVTNRTALAHKRRSTARPRSNHCIRWCSTRMFARTILTAVSLTSTSDPWPQCRGVTRDLLPPTHGCRATSERYRAVPEPCGPPPPRVRSGWAGGETTELGDSCRRTARNRCQEIMTTIARTRTITAAQPRSRWRGDEATWDCAQRRRQTSTPQTITPRCPTATVPPESYHGRLQWSRGHTVRRQSTLSHPYNVLQFAGARRDPHFLGISEQVGADRLLSAPADVARLQPS